MKFVLAICHTKGMSWSNFVSDTQAEDATTLMEVMAEHAGIVDPIEVDEIFVFSHPHEDHYIYDA